MSDNKMQGYEDVTLYRPTEDREQELLDKQIECNFVWANKAGHALGVIMNYVAKDGHIWLTATKQRPRVKALQCDPRASVIISSMGTDMGPGKQLSYKGSVIMHEDQATKDWFYPAMGAIISPYPAPTLAAAIEHLDTPLRVIIQFIPDSAIKFDGDSLSKTSYDGDVPGQEK